MKATACSRHRVRSAVAQILNTALLVTPWLAGPAAAAVEYEARTFNSGITPTDINDNGWVTGKEQGNPTVSAVLQAGRSRPLASNAVANAVNNMGVVVGQRIDSWVTRAFRSTPAQSEAIEDLGLLAGGTVSVATAINESGTAVGYANTVTAVSGVLVDEAVYFSLGEQRPESLGHLAGDGGVAAYAYGINDNGDIVGAFRKADGKYKPFRYLASGELKPLPGFEDVDAKAVAINNSGRIAGNLTYSDGRQRGFVFENGVPTPIEAPAPDAGKYTWVYGLNNIGQVIGEYACGTTTCPFVTDNGHVINLLNAMPGYTAGSARAINNFGEIAVLANNSVTLVLSPRRQRPVIQYASLPSDRVPATSDAFGSAIALHGDMAVIGAPGENNNTGAAYVYRFGNAQWTEVQRITAADSRTGGRFGESVAFDGTTIVVGAPGQDAAYVFQRTTVDWVQTASLPTGTGSTVGSKFGAAVAVKDSRVIVGAPWESSSVYLGGAAYVFDWNGAQWDRTKLVPADVQRREFFGTSVQIDGDSILVGAPTECCSDGGAVYVFLRQTNGWSELKLTPTPRTINNTNTNNFGRQIVIQNNELAIRSDYYVYLFRRGTTTEEAPWVAQDWVPSKGPITTYGDRLMTVRYENGKSYAQVLKHEGRLWVDAFDLPLDGTGPTAMALDGNTLLVGTSTGVIPYSICPEAPCTNAPPADIKVELTAPPSARVSALMTHTLTVTNLNSTAAAAYAGTTSTLLNSSGTEVSWVGLPEGCHLSLSRRVVSCLVTSLAPLASVQFELKIAAPAVSGTFTHDVLALHAGPDPAPDNNTASTTTIVEPSSEPSIDIYAPSEGQTLKREPGTAIDLTYEIKNFAVGLNGNYFTVRVDSLDAVHYNQEQKVTLGRLPQGKHVVTVALMTKTSSVPVARQSVTFYVEVVTPSVVITYPSADAPVACHKGELIAPRVDPDPTLDGSGNDLLLEVDGIPRGAPMTSKSAIANFNLCELGLGTTHTLVAELRDSAGKVKASSSVTFELRKAPPKITIRQPVDGGVDYARGGFTLIYDFDPGYDGGQLTILLNGSALPGPLPSETGTNSVPLTAEMLRDGANELRITVTPEGGEVQTTVVSFTTQAAATPPPSNGGALGLWALLLLVFARGGLHAYRSQAAFQGRFTRMRAWFRTGLSIVLLLGAGRAFATEYDIRPIGISAPTAINERGWVTGQSSGPYYGSPLNASLYAGRLRPLTPGTAHGINAAGTVVGASTGTGKSRAFRANPTIDDTIVDLGVLAGGNTSVAYSINTSGVAAGTANVVGPTGSVDHAVVFEADKIEDLGFFANLGGVGAYAYGINDSRTIVGAFKKADGTYRPFQIGSGPPYTLVGFDDVNAQAISINNAGRIVGNVTLSDGSTRAFFYQDGKRTDIMPDGGGATRAYGQNNNGQIVGSYTVTGTNGVSEERAFLFDQGKFVDLNTLLDPDNTLIFGTAYAINDSGAIVTIAIAGNNVNIYVVSPRVATPMIQHPALPLPRIPGTTDLFGSSIAVSGDLAVVGAPGENNYRGAVYVYRFDGTLWREEARLATTSSAGQGFGVAVATDGTTIVATTAASSSGHVFQREASNWTETAVLVPENPTNIYCGYYGCGPKYGSSVSVNGARIVIGAPYETVATDAGDLAQAGAIYIYDRNGAQWGRQRITAPQPLSSGWFGDTVAAQDNVVVVGETWPCFGNCNCNGCSIWKGRSYLYTHENGSWRQQLLVHSHSVPLDAFGSSIDISGDTLVVAGHRAASIFKRIDTPNGSEWIEQDWIDLQYSYWYGSRVAIDGGELAIGFPDSGNATYARTYNSVGRVWFETLRIDPEVKITANALAFRGRTLFFSSQSANAVTPISICPKSPCDNTVVADLSITVDAASDAYTSENLTHSITVKNNHSSNTAPYVVTRSDFTTSSGAGLNWIDVPKNCFATPGVGRVDCGLGDLAPNEQRRLDFYLAAPTLSGTLTHTATVMHVGPDPTPANNKATSVTAILSTGQPGIRIYSPPALPRITQRKPQEEIALVYELPGFDVGLNGNYFTVSVDRGTATRYDSKKSISLGLLAHGEHSVTIELRNTSGTTPRDSKTVNFSVQVETPEVVIDFPKDGTTVYCRSDNTQPLKVVTYSWDVGTSGRLLRIQVDGEAFGEAISTMSTIEALDLCKLDMGRSHTIMVSMHYSDGTLVEGAKQVTFDVQKAIATLLIHEPQEGITGYPRDGFKMTYDFKRGYDATQIRATLNGKPLDGPFEQNQTNSVDLPQDVLRDGSNDLVVTVTSTSEGNPVQVSTVHFYTNVEPQDSSKSKGGMVEMQSLALLLLLWAMRLRQFPRSRITPIRVDLSRPRSK